MDSDMRLLGLAKDGIPVGLRQGPHMGTGQEDPWGPGCHQELCDLAYQVYKSKSCTFDFCWNLEAFSSVSPEHTHAPSTLHAEASLLLAASHHP